MTHVNSKYILLVHPLGRSSEDDVSRLANIMPPLGLASMAAYLEREGYACDIVDYYARPDSDARVRELLLERRPALIGFSCTTPTFMHGVRIAQMAKGVLPEVKSVFGGVHVSAQKERVLTEYADVDYVVVGEGELTLLDLARCEGKELESVAGLAYRDGGEARFNGYRKERVVLDDLPFPAYEKLEGYPQDYTLPIFNYPTAPNTSCTSSRGCPYACHYCDRSVFRRSYSFNSAEYLYEHMKYLNERFGIRHINFYDDQFTFHQPRVEKFCKMLVDKPLGMTFNCAVRANHVDEEQFRQLKAAGCWMVSLGIESGSQDLLTRHGRKLDVDTTAQVVRLAKKAGLRVKGLVMMGLPGETEESIRQTKEYVFSMPLDDFNLTKFTPFPGAPLYANIRDHGEFEEDWERMDCMHFLFVPKGLTRERMEVLFKEFYKDHYTRARTLWGYVTMLWKSPDSWRRFLANLGAFLKFAASGKRYDDS